MTNANFPQPIEVAKDVWQIDVLERNTPKRTAAYLILDDAPTLIETGAANSHDALIHGLSALELRPADLAHVIVTHVHLDHAGGAGQMMAKATNADLVVHPRGARHMADPSKLWAGASEVYGERANSLFGAMVPVPADKICTQAHGSKLAIGKRTLQFFDSPGHAKHHFTILDELSDALFAGDAVGICYPDALTHFGYDFILPSSSPIDFDPAAVHSTLTMLEQLPFTWVYHAHFGRSPKATAIEETGRWVDMFAALIEEIYTPHVEIDTIEQALRTLITTTLRSEGHALGDMSFLDMDMKLDAMGLKFYEEKRRR